MVPREKQIANLRETSAERKSILATQAQSAILRRPVTRRSGVLLSEMRAPIGLIL